MRISPYTSLVKVILSALEVCGCFAAVWLGEAGWITTGIMVAVMTTLLGYAEGRFWSFYESECNEVARRGYKYVARLR